MSNNCLILPVVTFSGQLSTLHFITEDGDKKFLKNGRKKGHYIYVHGDRAAASRIIICEGWATGCSIAIYEPNALVISAIDTGNLLPVATTAKETWPNAEIIIAGDDDRQTTGNPGATKARQAAQDTSIYSSRYHNGLTMRLSH